MEKHLADDVQPFDPATRLGPIGDEVVFENEYVRVWGLALDPGGRQPWHKHDLPYLVIPLTEGDNEMHFADGRRRPTKESPGTALWREPGIPHELFNRSGWRYRNILVELKIAGFGKA
jgi:quercetin dioxygenase-like cupin family protein